MGEPFGHLLTVDLYGCNMETIDSINECYIFLENLVALLCMDKQGPPIIFRGDEELYPEKGQGISGWVGLIQSGIQIHTITGKKFCSLDIYTCGKLDKKKVIEYSVSFFEAEDAEVNYIERGTRY